jgi:hypothetical protein
VVSLRFVFCAYYFLSFPQSTQAYVKIIPRLDHNHFLPNSLQSSFTDNLTIRQYIAYSTGSVVKYTILFPIFISLCAKSAYTSFNFVIYSSAWREEVAPPSKIKNNIKAYILVARHEPKAYLLLEQHSCCLLVFGIGGIGVSQPHPLILGRKQIQFTKRFVL